MFNVLALTTQQSDGLGLGPGLRVALIFLMLLGMIYCRRKSHRPGVCKDCMTALLLGLLGCALMLSRELALAYVFAGWSGLSNLIVAIGVLLSAATIFMGVLGLVSYTKRSDYTHGGLHAIAAFLLAPLILYMVCMSMAPNRGPEKLFKGRVLEYGESGFSFRVPGDGYVRIREISYDPQVKMSLVRSEPVQVRLSVSVLPDTDGLTELDAIVGELIDEMKFADENMTIDFRESHTVGKTSGVRLKTSTVSDGVRTSESHWICLKDDVRYRLSVSGAEADKSRLEREAERFFAGVTFIGAPAGPSNSNDPRWTFTYFKSPHFGYSMNLRGKNWDRWADVDDEFPSAELGGLCDNENTCFLVVPVFYNGVSRPHIDALTWAALQTMGIEHPDSNTSDLKPVTQGNMDGYVLDHEKVIDGDTIRYRARILSGPRRGLMIIVWTMGTKTRLDTRAKEVFDGVKFRVSYSGAAQNSFGIADKASQAELINYLGVSCYKARQYDKALEYCGRASELDPRNLVYLTNTLETYYEQSRFGEGLKFLERSKSFEKTDPAALLWRAKLLAGAGKARFAIEAMKSLFDDGHRDDDDFVYYLDLLAGEKMWDQADAASKKYLAKDASLAVHIKLAEMLSDRGKYSEAIRLLRDRQDRIPFNTEIAYALIYAHLDAEEPADALKVCRALIDNNYESADAYYAMGLAQCDLRLYRKAKKSLEAALKSAPEDARVKRSLRYVSGLLGEGGNSTIKDPIDPVRLPQSLVDAIAAADEPTNIADYGAWYPARIEAFAHKKGQDFRYTRYRKIKILNNSGVSKFSTMRVTFDSVYERVFVNKLIVRDKNGKVIAAGKTSDYYVVDADAGQTASNDRTLNAPVPSVQVGCTIEFVATIRQLGKTDMCPLKRRVMAARRPVGVFGVYFAGDPDSILHHTANADQPARVDGGLLWSVVSPPVYRYEPRQAMMEQFLPMVCIAGKGESWTAIAEEYLKRISDKLQADKTVTDLAGKLTQGLKTRDEKINAIVHYVESNCTYKAIEFGVRAQTPNSAARTLSNRYGDCKDHAVLTRQLLAAVGVKAHLTLVSTDWKIRKSIPSLGQFNHMIIYVPDSNRGRFIDTVDKSMAPSREVPLGLAGDTALIMDDKNPQLASIPQYPSGCSTARCRRKLKLDPNGGLTVSDTLKLTGYSAGAIRERLKSVDSASHTRYLQRVLSSYLESIVVQRVKVTGLFKNADDLEIEIDYLLKGRSGPAGDGMTLEVPCLWGRYFLEASPVSDRQSPFVLHIPFEIETTATISVPEGMEIVRPERLSLNDDTKFAKWLTAIDIKGKTCTTSMSCKLRPGRFKPTQYAEYYATIDRLLSRASQRLRLKRLKTSRIK